MKKSFKIILFFTFFTTLTFAQGERLKEKREQIKALKIGYLTTELSLTADEATKFWPVFNAFEDKQFEIRRQKLKNYLAQPENENLDAISEKEALARLSQLETTEEDLYQLRKKFILNLKSILPAIKILKLKRAEEQFSKKLLQQYRKG